jgi:hypothetical protein
MRTAVLLLAFVASIFAGDFTLYPGATKLPDRAKHNPDHAISYSTPDTFKKVVQYYRGSGKVTEPMPGTAEIHFDGGEGILVRDLQRQGTVIVVVPPKKK